MLKNACFQNAGFVLYGYDAILHRQAGKILSRDAQRNVQQPRSFTSYKHNHAINCLMFNKQTLKIENLVSN